MTIRIKDSIVCKCETRDNLTPFGSEGIAHLHSQHACIASDGCSSHAVILIAKGKCLFIAQLFDGYSHVDVLSNDFKARNIRAKR